MSDSHMDIGRISYKMSINVGIMVSIYGKDEGLVEKEKVQNFVSTIASLI